MYLDHFGLREAPFLITPHAEFFFGGANRSALLDALVYALSREEGLVKVSGEVGTGKTMLARVSMGRLPAHLRPIYLADPLMNRAELLAVLADELGCADAAGDSAHRLLRAVQQSLVDQFAAGRQIVLLIDEAHAMPADTLEQIRLLSNLESERHKLIKIALFGQPELDALLDRPDMRQLKDRITQHFRLDPLGAEDVATYIDFRMRAAGYRGPAVFERAAAARIAHDSGGLTRRINVLADKALLAAFARSSHAVTLADARRAADDSRIGEPIARPRRRALAYAAATVVALALVGGGFVLGRALPPAKDAPPVPTATPGGDARHADASVQPPATRPAAETPSPTRSPASAPAGLSADSPADSSADSSAGLPADAAAAPPAGPTDGPAAAPSDAPDALQALIDSSRAWTAHAPGERWFIQLMSVPADRGDHVLDYVRRAGRAIDPHQLRAYRTGTANGAQVAVIFGDFPDRRSAQQAADELPDWIASSRPLPRQLRSLREGGK